MTIDAEETTAVPGMEFLKLRLLEVRGDGVRISTDPDDDDGFDVSYFDMPMTDNTTQGSATIRVVQFPEYYFRTRSSIDVDQLIGEFVLEN